MKNLQLMDVHLCSGARFDQNGGMSALGIMPRTIMVTSFPSSLSFTLIGHVRNSAPRRLSGKICIFFSNSKKDILGEAPFYFDPTGKGSTLFIVPFLFPFRIEEEGTLLFQVKVDGDINAEDDDIICSLEIKKISSNLEIPRVSGLSTKDAENLKKDMEMVLMKYLPKAK